MRNMLISAARTGLTGILMLLATANGHAQTEYTHTLPQMQGYNLTNWTAFTFPNTPNTVGEGTITFNWLACYQGGFGTNGVQMEIRTGASAYTSVLNYTGGTISCSFQPRTVVVSAALMQQALAYSGGASIQGRVRVNDACQPGVGCSSYNDPVINEMTLAYTTTAANFTSPDATKCPGEVVQFTDASINAPTSHSWSFPGGVPTTSNLPNPAVQYAAPGQYDVTLTVVTGDGESSITRTGFVTILDLPTASAGADQFVCEGEAVQLQAGGGSTYAWTPTTGLNDPGSAAPLASPGVTTTYTVLVTSAQGCQASDQVIVNVVPEPLPVIDAGEGVLCAGDSLAISATGATFYSWSPNLFISGTVGDNVVVWPTADQTWTVTGTDAFGCAAQASVTIEVLPAAQVPVITWGDMVLESTEAGSYQWYLEGTAIAGATGQTWTPLENGNYTVTITDANGCTATSAVYYFGSVGIGGTALDGWRVYPQPARDVLHLVGAIPGSAYRLVDGLGRTVLHGRAEAGVTTIDVGAMAPGVHVLHAIAAGGPMRSVVMVD